MRTKPSDALCAPPFDWVFANLLKRELLPIVAEIAAATCPGGRAIFSGLLGSEREDVVSALSTAGFSLADERSLRDANGDEWISLLMTRA